MKWLGRRLERRWRKYHCDYDQTQLRAHYRAYSVAIRLAKRQYFSSRIASSVCRPAELFRVVRDLLQPNGSVEVLDHSK